MNKIVLALLVISYFNCVGCKPNSKEIKDKTSSESKIFEYKNDTLSQRVEVFKINNDTLKVNIKTSNLKRKTSCSIEGIAIRDTVGDFLEEEETVQDENGEVFSVIRYRFFYKGTVNLLDIELDRVTKNRLVYYKVESGQVLDKPYCLLYSVGTLREKTTTEAH
jgi:hypothetical protein